MSKDGPTMTMLLFVQVFALVLLIIATNALAVIFCMFYLRKKPLMQEDVKDLYIQIEELRIDVEKLANNQYWNNGKH